MMVMLNIIGILTIAFIIWWFWFSKPNAVKVVNDKVKIVVKDGVYSPAVIEVSSEQEVSLAFIRKDESVCSQYLVFESLNISQELPLNQVVEIRLGKLPIGHYPFSCQMKMYSGKLIVT